MCWSPKSRRRTAIRAEAPSARGLGGLIGHGFGGLLGGISSRKMEANTVLSLTNVRTTETIAVQDGYAAKNSISFGGGGGGFWGAGGAALVGGGYDSTDIGRIVTLAFIQAYAKMVTDLGLVTPGTQGTAEAAPTKTFTAMAPVAMRAAAPRPRPRSSARSRPARSSIRPAPRTACGGKSPTRTTMSAGCSTPSWRRRTNRRKPAGAALPTCETRPHCG